MKFQNIISNLIKLNVFLIKIFNKILLLLNKSTMGIKNLITISVINLIDTKNHFSSIYRQNIILKNHKALLVGKKNFMWKSNIFTSEKILLLKNLKINLNYTNLWFSLLNINYDLLAWLKLRVIYYVNNWIYTTNHKRIAVNYFWFVILSGIVGMVLATLIRLEFAYPGVGVFAGDSLQYLSLVTAHGVIMVFFMIMPLLFGAFANFLLPTQLGVHDVAFPRLNSAAFWFLPGGLLMLCQLVCIDRRYQRMNCFNIREIQSLLKQRFFQDLINIHEYHESLNKLAPSLRFKINSINTTNSNASLLYSFGLSNSTGFRSFFTKQSVGFENFLINDNSNFFLKFVDLLKNNTIFNFYYILSELYFYILSLFIAVFKPNLLNFYLLTYSQIFLLIENMTYLANNILIFFWEFFSISFIYNSVVKLFYISLSILNQVFFFIKTTVNNFITIFNHIAIIVSDVEFKNLFIHSLTILAYIWNYMYFFFYLLYSILGFFINTLMFNLYSNLIYFFFDSITFINTNFTCNLNFLLNIIFSLKTNFFFKEIYFLIFFFKKNQNSNLYDASDVFISSNYYTSKNQNTTDNNVINWRNVKFNDPIFRYDYKSGDYFPKLYRELYTSLFTTFSNLTGGIKTSAWFFSDKFTDVFNTNFSTYFNTLKSLNNNMTLNSFNRISNSHSFYNFFYSLHTDTQLSNIRWLSIYSLNQKFNKLFTTSSMQQRVYANWRQLKFTREAWRCKLLTARHQKTLFRRYTHEDGIFWSIERNAKDLLPGWAMITPFSSRVRFTAIGKTDIGLMGVFLVLNSSIISAANFLVTYRYLSTLNNRKMRDARAFFTEGIMVASWMMILANPMLVIGIIMLLSDRHWQTSFFDYSGGGDTVLFQHMFWFFGHPEVYVIIIPTFGFTNTILSYYLKKRVSARASLLYSMYTIAFLGFFVWGHHMYMVGLAHTTRMLFSTLTVMISVPAATKIMHWCVTIANSSFATELPLLFSLTFIFFFVSGGISGMSVAHTGMDVLLHDTFYVIGHFHVMLAGAAMFSSFGAFYFYFPSIFGVKFSRIYAYLHYSYYLIGQLMTIIPMIWLGFSGMPRRVLDYPSAFGGWHSVISAGHMLSVAGLMAFFIMIFDSLRQSRAVIRTTFGISRYNIRLSFYLFEIAKLNYVQQKSIIFFRPIYRNLLKKNEKPLINFESYETVLIEYNFLKI